MSEPTPPGQAPQEHSSTPPPAAPPPPPAAPPPPAGGYTAGPPPVGAAPVGYANSDEKTWALIAHFGGIVVGFIAPLVALLAKGNESPTVKAHATEALNFQITWGAAMIIGYILAICTSFFTFGLLFVLPFVAWLMIIIFSILAGIKANEGVLYQYPASVRLVK